MERAFIAKSAVGIVAGCDVGTSYPAYLRRINNVKGRLPGVF